MSALWQRYVAWFAARNPRERGIIAAALLFLILYPAYFYVIEPAILKTRSLSTQAAQQREAAVQLQAQLAMQQMRLRDPDMALKKALSDLQQQLEQQHPRFRVVERAVIPAAQVTALLERLLSRNRSLQLVSLKTLPPVALIERKLPAPAATESRPAVPEANVYRHGVEIAVSGSYADLLAYLNELEKSPQPVLWGKLVLDASDHARIVMTLTVNTLSLDQAWLAL